MDQRQDLVLGRTSAARRVGAVLEANGAFELPANFGLTAHVGYSDGDDVGRVRRVLLDWVVGVTYTLGNFTWA